jgi:Haem-binding uptake, Tiki superfamily, ChaN
MKMNSIQRYSRKAFLFFLISGFASLAVIAQKPAYKLFREDGKKVKYEKMAEVAAEADIVLFGEYHTNPISHWLQLELTEDLFEARGEELILGAEMFEADNQLILNEYMAGQITELKFEEEARLWKNYATDYKPLVLIAKDKGLPFVASNIPRRYANMVFKRGILSLDSLSDEAKSYIAPLPLEYDTSLNCYKQLMGGGSPVSETVKPKGEMKAPGADKLAPMGGHGSTNLADAQAIKDATMVHFILEHWEAGKLLVHYNGAYHSDEFESMYWFLKRANPDLKIVTISTVSQDDVDALEEDARGKADFIIAVPSNMTQTSR